MDYQNAKTDVVKKLIATLPYDKGHSLVNALLALEQYIENGLNCFAEYLHFTRLKVNHERYYLMLLKELNNKAYEKTLKEQRESEEDYRINSEKERKKDLKRWIKAGGVR